MRIPFRFALLTLFALASPAFAEKPKVNVTSARVGLPPGGRTIERDDNGPVHISKFAAWAPVFVTLELLEPVDERVELVVETPDADEVMTTLAVPINLAGLSPGRTINTWAQGAMLYMRPTGGGGETTVFVRTTSGMAISAPLRLRYLRTRDSLTYVMLSLGATLKSFDLPKASTATQAQPTGDSGLYRNGRVELATISEVDDLPTQWFGYDAADLVILNTGEHDFLDRLFSEKGSAADKQKAGALLEWVRRGGRIVVAVGVNAGGVVKMPALAEMLPVTIDQKLPVKPFPEMPLSWVARESASTTTVDRILGVKSTPVALANIVPRAGRSRVVIPPANRPTENAEPIAVQSSFGLGRVTLVAFDFDRQPFTDFADRAEFWDWLLRECGANKASIGLESRVRPPSSTLSDEEDEVAAALRTHIDTFDAVPVISFGWVAFLIALYTLLIAPLEYYFLKRIFGRLELTWLTFPIIVLTVCLLAYFSTVSLKGRELRVNKVDVIDVVGEFDSNGKPGGRVYGTTMFTIFSPKIATYSAGVTPAAGWTANNGSTVMSWVGAPRGGHATLLRRRYNYHVNEPAVADGLENVPVQVWSTKSFTANWAADMDTELPVIESRLEHPPGGRDFVIGSFINRVPFPEITDCVAFYAGKAYPIGTILGDSEVRLVLDKGRESLAQDWLQREGQLPNLLARSPSFSDRSPTTGARTSGTPAAATSGPLPLWGLLFHEASLRNEEGVVPRNSSLRRLDQSWRLSPENRSEVILVGRVLPEATRMKSLQESKETPTLVWLKGLPQTANAADEIPGIGRQESYVRLYLPVKPARQWR